MKTLKLSTKVQLCLSQSKIAPSEEERAIKKRAREFISKSVKEERILVQAKDN